MSTIYWKFKNTKQEFSSVTFDSTHVSILDLKRAIIKQKKLQQTPQQPFDLSIINAHTGVEYTDETGPIPRNLAVIVRRLPAARNQHKKLWAPLQNNSIIATADNISKKQIQTISERLNQEFGAPIFNDSGGNGSSAAVNAEVNQVENETMNIIDMMNRRMNNGTSTTTTTTINTRNNRRDNMRNNRNNDRNNNHNNNNNNNSGDGKDGKQSYRSQRGDPPPGYICHRCHVSGHWIQDCPTNGDPKYDKKNRAQTLRSNLPDSVPKPATPTNVSGDGSATANVGTQQVIIGKKCYQIPTNVYESFKGDHSKIKAYIEISKGTNSTFSSSNTTQGSGEHSKYKCELCHNFYNDARFVPCCHVTYCNECIRQKSLPQNPSMIQCPSCQELFTSDVLNDAKNTKLQEKVDKLLSKLQKESNQHQIPTDTSSAINLNNPQSLTLQPPTTIVTPQHPNASPNTTNNSSSAQTIQIPHPNQPQQTVHHIPQPVITRTAVRPTVILQQSPPIIPPPTPLQPQVPQAIDTSTFEAPKATFVTGDSAHYTCIECGQRGHKYKDCPKVAERQQQQTIAPVISEKPALEAASGSSSTSGSDSDEANVITNSADIAMISKSSNDNIAIKGGNGDRKHREQKLTDLEPLGRIPKKTAAEMLPKSSGSGRGSGGGGNRHNNKNNNMNLNQNLGGNNMNATSGYHGNHGTTTTTQQRMTPQVQLINNSTMGSNYSAMGNINALNNLQQMSMMNSLNVRNRLVNNVLMNAALHNATRRGGIAPRLINSNPLLNPLLNRNPHLLNNINTLNHTAASTNPLSILQQQSLLTQQAALNRLRSNNPLLANTINNNINLNTANINLGGNNSSLHNQPTVNITNTNTISNNARIANTTTNTNTSNAANANMPNITQDVLTQTIQELKQVMTLNASNPSAVSDAINAAFIKLGAKDADAKRIVLEKLVATCGGINGAQQATPQSIDGNNSDNSMEKESHSKSKKKKKSKSKSKRSKKKKKDKDRKSSKDKESRRERRKHKKRERERKERRRDRSRRDDRDRESGSGRDRDRARKDDRESERDRDRSRSRDRGSRSRNKGSSDSDDDNLNDRQLSVSLEPPTQENNNNTSTTINTDEVNKNIDERGNNSSQNVASSGTDFPDPDDEEEENIIHVNVVNENDKSGKKRKLPPAPIPDFAVSPPPPNKRQKIASQIPSPSISPTVEDDK